MEEELFICSCHSLEHQIMFWYDKDESGILYALPHLTTYRNFIERLWYGLKYAFGYKSKFGAWDSTIFDSENLSKLKLFLENIKEDG